MTTDGLLSGGMLHGLGLAGLTSVLQVMCFWAVCPEFCSTGIEDAEQPARPLIRHHCLETSQVLALYDEPLYPIPNAY